MNDFMEMRRCETCGGGLNENKEIRIWQCRFCGNKLYVKNEKSDTLIHALNRATELRQRNDFDGAIVEYSAILKEHPNDDEANWGMFISRCGIEYVKDDRTGVLIPTSHRTLDKDVLNDPYYKKAIENAADEQAEIFQSRARVIARLQEKIKQQLNDEEEYDVFISFKSKDENGYPTKDSVIARNIYDRLDMAGIKTFFSEVTLANRIGDDFEPIIYKALYSCKYFILVTTSDAHTNAVWVKNEWSRFRDRMHEEGLTKCAFAVFEGNGCVPGFLRGMQGFDLSKYPNGGYEIQISEFLTLSLGKDKRRSGAPEISNEAEQFETSVLRLQGAKRTIEWCRLVEEYREKYMSSSVEFRTDCVSVEPILKDLEAESASVRAADALDKEIKELEFASRDKAWCLTISEKSKAANEKIRPYMSYADILEKLEGEARRITESHRAEDEKTRRADICLMKKALKELNVSLKGDNGKPDDPKNVYWKIITSLNKIYNPIDKDRLCKAIFGVTSKEAFSHIRTDSKGGTDRSYCPEHELECIKQYMDDSKSGGNGSGKGIFIVIAAIIAAAVVAVAIGLGIFAMLNQEEETAFSETANKNIIESNHEDAPTLRTYNISLHGRSD